MTTDNFNKVGSQVITNSLRMTKMYSIQRLNSMNLKEDPFMYDDEPLMAGNSLEQLGFGSEEPSPNLVPRMGKKKSITPKFKPA